MRIIFPDKHKKTPFFGRLLKRVPLFVLIISCTAPFVSYVMKKVFGCPGVIETLALSTKGVCEHKFWQFLTYPLVTSDCLSISNERCLEVTQRLLIRNCLDFVLFYKATDHIVRKLGSLPYLALISSQILITGTIVWAALHLLHSSQAFFGPECLIATLVLVWVFLDPEKRLAMYPLPTSLSRKWGFIGLLGFYFFILLVSGAFAVFLGSVISILIGIIFCHKEKIPNPYRLSRF
ncbi:hypothetical protein CP10139811_0473 [Chlamydia ibidis]|uniref:Uncharacterized protein n=2 Tax=Chlamydia ibidis TaxID=1405396 RepID=S7KJJ6_9CHLA|nr:hypothetical protein [Chlamydia ibidis]EPP34605.1 hypothetical protein CP10139811_0473 [Chlamydia ibidis]EQM62469.1 hypothetical protein H359_0851 [Chlamydia ibidis 10-1398/6]